MNPHLRPLLAASASLVLLAAALPAAHAYPVVVSQLYSPGGGGGAFDHAFIELHNNSASPVSLAGWSVQYSLGTGLAWVVTPLSGVIQPGQYYLVQEGPVVTGSPLPTPDAIGPSFMPPALGKVAIVASTLAVPNCPVGVIDLVGWGNVECFEGATAQPMTPNNGLRRKQSGCQDTDVNSADFMLATPVPRNTSSAIVACGPVPPSGTVSLGPPSVRVGRSTMLSAIATTGYNPLSTGLSVDVDLTPIGGAAAQPLYDDGTHGDVTPDDHQFAFLCDVPLEAAPGEHSLTFTIRDLEGREHTVNAILTLTPAIVISQIYSAGNGGPSAKFDHAFVELHNRGATAVSLVGWSVQYADLDGNPWQVTPLGGYVQPGQYILVRMGNPAAGAPPLPTPDFIGNTFILPALGRFAVFSTTAVADSCGTAQPIVDFLGYGMGACYEGSGRAPSMHPQIGMFRKDQGCQDNDDNVNDFVLGNPAPRNSASPFVTCSSVAPLAVAAATPDDVTAGNTTLLTLAITPGQHPTSAAYVVEADLSALGLSNQVLHDDGLDGDVAAGDLVYSYLLGVPALATGGTKTLPLSACDDRARCAGDDAVIEVQATTGAPAGGATATFALRGATPNPSSGGFAIRFSLARPGPATLALIDVSGRTVASRAVGAMGAGEHVVRIGDTRLAPGVYLARLTQFGRSVGTRVVITR